MTGERGNATIILIVFVNYSVFETPVSFCYMLLPPLSFCMRKRTTQYENYSILYSNPVLLIFLSHKK